LAQFPFKEWKIDPGPAIRTLCAAKGRLALDRGQLIESEALALLGGASIGYVRNLTAGTNPKIKLKPKDNGKWPAVLALAWLQRRKSFEPSRWRWDNRAAPRSSAVGAEIDDVVFVPVSGNGEMFLPNLPEYVVGRGRQQRTIGNYDEALAALQRLAEPIWKKPKPGGG